ncbi:hypothetical protein AGMMS49975_01320 [Clostridia bacterium]|nr:hypothetical protein AGMMS49975_01320 [Clostridia bacterium]
MTCWYTTEKDRRTIHITMAYNGDEELFKNTMAVAVKSAQTAELYMILENGRAKLHKPIFMQKKFDEQMTPAEREKLLNEIKKFL